MRCTSAQASDRASNACSGEGAGWGPQARLPAPGQLCYESLQIARYQAGQHFRPHEVRALARRLRGGCWELHSVLFTSSHVRLHL